MPLIDSSGRVFVSTAGIWLASLVGFLMLAAQPSWAQSSGASPTQQIAPDRCLALAQKWAPRPTQAPPVVRAGIRVAELAPYQARVTFLGHATMLIESPKGVKAATDYAVPIGPPNTPDIVTMNNSHTSHFTFSPQPEINHVLEGWGVDGTPRLHDLTVDDMRVRNIPTNTRNWEGGTRIHGNSIFVFEVASLCLAHLGHLHHTLTPQHLANIGQMDVVFAPVDGSWTLDLPGMFEVIEKMNPRYVIPMHYFSKFTLERFLEPARSRFKVTQLETSTIVLSKDKLPAKTEILVLPSRHGHSFYDSD